MPFITGNVEVEEITPTKWKLLQDVEYRGKKRTFTVGAGRVTDFASVPRIFFWLLPSYGVYTKAAILHDYLCETKEVSRDEADGIFRRSMRELGTPFVKRWIMWAAVRLAGRLEGATLAEFVLWLIVFVPGVVFFFIPAVVVSVWLGLFWVIELVFYWILTLTKKLSGKPVTKKVNPPKLLPSTPPEVGAGV